MNSSIGQHGIRHNFPAEQRAPAKWSVIREVGVEYTPALEIAEGQMLRFPSLAARASDGTYLIVDELGVEKNVPYRFECRTICVDAAHGIFYDTMEHGIDDGYGCLINDGCMAVLRRTKWELLIVSRRGTTQSRFGLAAISKRTPRLIAWTPGGTFLIAFLDRAGQMDLAEVDPEGRLLWFLPPRTCPIGVPASIQLLPSDNLLVADPFRHVAVEIDRAGTIVWQFGEAKDPSSLSGRLSNPGSIRSTPDGKRLIADTRNHRVMLIGADGDVSYLQPEDGNLHDPVYADGLEDGHFLICDTGNQRVIEIDRQGKIAWQYGHAVAKRRFLSYPRSVDLTADGGYLVADTAHNRIVEFANGRVQERPFRGHLPLFWPRCARVLPGDSLLIADGRNHRIVEVSQEGDVLRELHEIDLDSSTTLKDPHDVWMLANGHLLVSDSQSDLVVEVDFAGRVHRVIGGCETLELDDPHSAQQLSDGCVVVADTGNDRVLLLEESGGVREIRALRAGASWLRLNRPKYVEVIADGAMVIVDTGHNRILAATMEGTLLWELSEIPDSRLPRLNQPRWAKLIHRDEVLVCDHYHHRILHMKYGSRIS